MRTCLAVAMLLVGCAVDHEPPAPTPTPTPTPMGLPTGCVQLVGSVDGMGIAVGPIAIDTTGIDICFHLDTTQIGDCDFFESTQSVPGASSPFDSALLATDGSTIQAGWDVSVGETATMTMNHLEWNMAGGMTLDATFHLSAKSVTTDTTFSISLFAPLED